MCDPLPILHSRVTSLVTHTSPFTQPHPNSVKTVLERFRCVHMLADLWHAPEPCEVAGCATVGSSEGVMMGGLALKRRWERRRKEAGLPFNKPNVIFGENAHVRALL